MDYMRFLHIANWSALEVETQIIIAERLGYIEKDLSWILQDTIGEIIKMIGWFIEYKKSNLSVKL